MKIISLLKKLKFFNFPSKKQILFYDFIPDQFMYTIFGSDKSSFIFDKDKKINFFIFMSIFFSYKSIKIIFIDNLITAYTYNYIRFVKANIVINSTDNNINFYLLKKHLKEVYFLAFQNGARHIVNDLFGNKKLIDNENYKRFSSDYIFTFNSAIGKMYEKYINCKTIAIGNLKNNKINLNSVSIKSGKIIYISQFRLHTIVNDYVYSHGEKVCTVKKWLETEKKLIPKLCEYANKKNLELYILGASRDYNSIEKEKLYFRKIAMGKPWKYWNPHKLNFKERYQSLDKFEVVISIWSTLGYELFGRYKKICFFRQNIQNLNDRNFGWPDNFSKKGFWYSSDITQSEVNRVLNNLRDISLREWIEKISLTRKKVMKYDKNNSILINKVNYLILNKNCA
jgi:surface carbohydrate biosynthesis protein